MLTEQQIRMILLDPSTDEAVGRKVEKSRSAIQRIRCGALYAEVAPELPRRRKRPVTSCRSCVHCANGKCQMDVPDFKEEGLGFAADCDFYVKR